MQAWISNVTFNLADYLSINLKWVKAVVFVSCLIPFVWLTYALFTNQLGANPVEVITRQSGLWALRFLLITLCVTPLRWFTGINSLTRFRRMLGLYTFFYATVHMLLYLGLDQSFNLHDIIRDIIKRPFITIGFFSFAALLPLVITSTNNMIKRLGGQRWRRLHKLTYFIAAASCLHYLMLVKADIRQPVIYIGILGILLAIRLYKYLQRRLLVA